MAGSGFQRSIRGVVALAVLTAFVSVGATSTAGAAGKKPLPQVTKKQATKILKSAVRLDIQSGITNDVGVLESFSTGLYSEIAKAQLEQAFAAGEPAFEGYEVNLEDVFTVRTTTYPQYFLALAENKIEGGLSEDSVHVFVKDSKKGDWLWERSIAHPADGWPEFLLDKDGYVVAEVKTEKLSIDPATVPAELATYLSGQAEPANAALFGDSIGTTDYRDATGDFAFTGWPDGFSETFTAAPTEHDVLIFPLKDGSALVTFGLKTTLHATAGSSSPEYALDLTEAPTIDPRIATGLYWDIVIEDLEAFSVLVPTAKSLDLLTAIPVSYGPLSARGSTVANPSEYQ